jgi:hypothetical protein
VGFGQVEDLRSPLSTVFGHLLITRKAKWHEFSVAHEVSMPEIEAPRRA